jgi:hypothetical protein
VFGVPLAAAAAQMDGCGKYSPCYLELTIRNWATVQTSFMALRQPLDCKFVCGRMNLVFPLFYFYRFGLRKYSIKRILPFLGVFSFFFTYWKNDLM